MHRENHGPRGGDFAQRGGDRRKPIRLVHVRRPVKRHDDRIPSDAE